MVHHPQGLTINGPYKASPNGILVHDWVLPVYHSMGETDLKSRIRRITPTWIRYALWHFVKLSACFMLTVLCHGDWTHWTGETPQKVILWFHPQASMVERLSWDDAEAGPGTWTSSSLGSFRRFGGAPNFRPKFGCVSMGKPLMLEPHFEKHHKTLMPKDPKG